MTEKMHAALRLPMNSSLLEGDFRNVRRNFAPAYIRQMMQLHAVSRTAG